MVKRKATGDELAPCGPTHPKRGGRRHGLLCRLRTHLPAAPMGVPRRTTFPHLAAWCSPGCRPERLSAAAPCVSLRYALPGPILLGAGFQRRGPRPPAFVSFQGGAGGNRNNTVTALRFPALAGRQSCRFLEIGLLYPPPAAPRPLSPCQNLLFCQGFKPRFRLPDRLLDDASRHGVKVHL